jgi:SAM-dependent methyltransferase
MKLINRIILYIIGLIRLSKIDFSDDTARIDSHKDIVRSKPVLKSLFDGMNQFIEKNVEKYANSNRLRILEIGSGVHPFSTSLGSVLTSDLVFNTDLNLIVDAQHLCIKTDSLDLVLGQFVFHHFPDPIQALSELDRVLTKGGLVTFIEPANTFLGKLLFPIMHKSEYFDPNASWSNSSRGSMENANQALSYIYFNRDFELFKDRFPQFEILEKSLLIPFGLRYIASGGLNFKQLLPTFLFNNLLKQLDNLFKFFAVHWLIILKKK